MGIFTRGGHGGGEAISTQRITFLGTVKEIGFFAVLYGLVGVLQIGLWLAVAVMLGALSGFVFVVLAYLLSYTPRTFFQATPPRFGVFLEQRFYNRKKPNYVSVTQGMLTILGVVLIVVTVTGHLPPLWEWRVDWIEGEGPRTGGYRVMSRWFGRWGWYEASNFEILARAILPFAVPFCGWGSLLMAKWAARMEVTRPSFRETPHGELSGVDLEGPLGEQYRPSKELRGSDGHGDDGRSAKPQYVSESLKID